MDEDLMKLVEVCRENKVMKDDIITASYMLALCEENSLNPELLRNLTYILVELEDKPPVS